MGDDLIQGAVLEKKPISITHTGDNHCTVKIGNVYANQIMVVPIFHNSSLIGVVELGHSWQKFSDETLELLTLSSQLIGMKIAMLESTIRIRTFSANAIKNKNKIEAHKQSLLLHQAELYQANEELKNQIKLLQETGSLLALEHIEQEKQALKLRKLNEKLDAEAGEKQKLADDLETMSEFARMNVEKAEHLASLGEANEKLFSINQEFIALNEELHKQNIEKEARAAELLVANVELAFQNREKEARAHELEEVYTAKEEFRSQMNHMQKLEMIGRLTSGVAHDFNNILSCILGYNEMNYDVSNMITDSLLRAELENNLNQIDLAGHRAVSLIQKMLTYCRKETSKEKMRVIPAQQVIDEALQMLHPLLTSQIKMEFINRCLINEGDCINCDYRNNCDTRIEV
ncbi:MAG: GAF domain-containing protein, partial [Methylococcaceae bacterium]